MKKNLPTFLHFPLFIISVPLLLGFWSPVFADDQGPRITLIEFPYPDWYKSAVNQQSQDSFKTGDPYSITIEVTDTSPITTVSADLSALGMAGQVSVPLFMDRTAQTHVYRTSGTVLSTTTGSAMVQVMVTDAQGITATSTKTVQLDNTPPTFSISSLSFASSSMPALGDTMFISGVAGPGENKIFVTDTYYTLYDANRNPVFALGSYRAKQFGVALSDISAGTFTNDPVQFWLDRNGEFHVPDASYISVTATLIDGASNSTTTTSALIPIPTNTTSTTSTPPSLSNGISNVLFLPGLEASRLYEPATGCDPATSNCAVTKVWDPASDADLDELMLDTSGKSIHRIYTKEDDTIDAVGPFKFYSSLAAQLDDLKTSGSIRDWRRVPYDWRLSPTTIVNGGVLHAQYIDYRLASSSPYIVQELKRLAASSKTGKVTIIAHSYGGLVAKALLQKIGTTTTAQLVDNVVLVGVPQSGTPLALAGALHGYGTALPADWCATWQVIGSLCAKDASREKSRSLAKNAPATYNLLPSAAYFASVVDLFHPVVSFVATHLFGLERAAYGTAITNEVDLMKYAVAADGGRSKPSSTNLASPNVLEQSIFTDANTVHTTLDAWTPPQGVHVYEIAGWGTDTLAGIQYYEVPNTSVPGGYAAHYRPLFVEDGDDAVVVPSALMMPTSSAVTRYWVNLTASNLLQPLGGAVHQNLLELDSIRTFIGNILAGTPNQLPDSITTQEPVTINPSKKLLFTLHGNAEATLKDAAGGSVTLHTDGSFVSTIENAIAGLLGDAEYILAPVRDQYQLLLASAESGSVDLDVQETENGVSTTTATLSNIPVGPGGATAIDISPEGSTSNPSVPTVVSSPNKGVVSRRIITVSRTKGIANSKSVLTPPKPIPVTKPKPVATSTPKKPTPIKLPKKAKEAIGAMLAEISARLQGMLVQLSGH